MLSQVVDMVKLVSLTGVFVFSLAWKSGVFDFS